MKAAAPPIEAEQGARAESRDGRTKQHPNLVDLLERLHFAPEGGRIWLDDQRMLLIHASALGALRHELIEGLGIERARGFLTRMGYHSGAHDATLARRLRPNASLEEAFSVGPQLHAIEGSVHVETISLDIDVERGRYRGEFLWQESSEDEEHVRIYGIGAEPACWTQVGYASGYTSVFMGRPILFREVECRSMGFSQCRIIGLPVEEWGDGEQDSRFLRAEPFVRGLSATAPADIAGAPLPETSALFADGEVVGVSAGFNAVCHKVKRVADTSATVLFLGESGVGKELFARVLHRISPRAQQAFVAVNCAAIPEALVESELFGVEKGAFTGATTMRLGRFERAHGGTLFLDEIGILGLTSQGKLLRALQEGEIERLGGTQVHHVDVRVVAATNLDLRAEVKAGRFREDLYFRLNVFPVKVPPLRERRDDVPILMNHFLTKFCKRHRRQVSGFTAKAIDALLSYELPGNIRELENMIERGVILAPAGGAIDVAHLFTGSEEIGPETFGLRPDGSVGPRISPDERLTPEGADPVNDKIGRLLSGQSCTEVGTSLDEVGAALEEALLRAAIERANGNVSEAARQLGISRSRLIYRLNHQKGEGSGNR